MPYKFLTDGLTVDSKVRMTGEVVESLPSHLVPLTGEEQLARYGVVHWIEVSGESSVDNESEENEDDGEEEEEEKLVPKPKHVSRTKKNTK